MTEEDPQPKDPKSRSSKHLSEQEDKVVDGVVDATKTIKSAVDTTIFGVIKGAAKGSIIAIKGVFSAGKTVTKETGKGLSEGVQGAKGETSSVKKTKVFAAKTTKGASKGVVKGSATLLETATETTKTLVSETTKGMKKTTDELTDSKDKIRKSKND